MGRAKKKEGSIRGSEELTGMEGILCVRGEGQEMGEHRQTGPECAVGERHKTRPKQLRGRNLSTVVDKTWWSVVTSMAFSSHNQIAGFEEEADGDELETMCVRRQV